MWMSSHEAIHKCPKDDATASKPFTAIFTSVVDPRHFGTDPDADPDP